MPFCYKELESKLTSLNVDLSDIDKSQFNPLFLAEESESAPKLTRQGKSFDFTTTELNKANSRKRQI